MTNLQSLKFFKSFLFFILLVASITWLQLPRVKALDTKSAKVSKEKVQHEENAEKSQLDFLETTPALGFNNLLANWAFLKFVQYFGDTQSRNVTGYSLVPDHLDIVVKNDPRFIGAYTYLSPASSIFAGRPDRTVLLLDKGLKFLSPELSPKSYLIWLYKGTDEMIFSGDIQAAKQSFEMAAEWASLQDDPIVQAMAARARETVQFLATNPDPKGAKARGWAMILSNARDTATASIAIKQIEALGGDVTITSEGALEIKLPEEK